MATVRAAILAAGRGVRMGGGTPKTLLPLGEHPSLLHHLLEGLERAGVTDLLVVTGHRPEEVTEAVTEQWSGGFTTIRNTRFASWGNFHSVRLALDQSPGFDLLVVNSDIVVHPDVFRRVIDKPGDLVLAVQRRHRLDQEDMRVQLDGDRVRGIGKQLHMARSHGEYCGVSLLRPGAHRAYADTCNSWEWRAQTTGYYEDVYAAIVRSVDARAAEVAAGEYAEVDTPEDVAEAIEVVERHFNTASA